MDVTHAPLAGSLADLIVRVALDDAIREVAARLRGGASVRELYSALLTANLHFRFLNDRYPQHCQFVLSGAIDLTLDSAEPYRLLPYFYALHYAKVEQARIFDGDYEQYLGAATLWRTFSMQRPRCAVHFGIGKWMRPTMP